MNNAFYGLQLKSKMLDDKKIRYDSVRKLVEDSIGKFLERFPESILTNYDDGYVMYLFNRRCEVDMTILKQCLSKVLQQELSMYTHPIGLRYHNEKYDVIVKNKLYDFKGKDHEYLTEDVLILTLTEYMKTVK